MEKNRIVSTHVEKKAPLTLMLSVYPENFVRVHLVRGVRSELRKFEAACDVAEQTFIFRDIQERVAADLQRELNGVHLSDLKTIDEAVDHVRTRVLQMIIQNGPWLQ